MRRTRSGSWTKASSVISIVSADGGNPATLQRARDVGRERALEQVEHRHVDRDPDVDAAIAARRRSGGSPRSSTKRLSVDDQARVLGERR